LAKDFSWNSIWYISHLFYINWFSTSFKVAISSRPLNYYAYKQVYVELARLDIYRAAMIEIRCN